MKIKIRYFAIFKEQANLTSEYLEIQNSTLMDIYDTCKSKYDFSLAQEKIKVSVNEEYKNWEYNPQDGDEIVFIPPVAGG